MPKPAPIEPRPPEPPLLAVRDLVVEFRTDDDHVVRAVDGVSLEVPAGAAVGVVGESGSGKSVTALSVLRLIRPPGRIASGAVLWRGRDLLGLDEREVRALRGDRLAMIFQEPLTALNPVYTAGDQIAEVLRVHKRLGRRAALDEAVELLDLVGIADPARRAREYPHQLSGGMRQRVMIAMALACRPDLVIADEPTTALDVTIQAQILELLGRLRRELGMSLVLITHDLGVVAETCEQVVVMYAGQVVEQAEAAVLFARPRHPYTAGLLRAIPSFEGASEGGDAGRGERGRLAEIPGLVPRLDRLPPGCRFQDRCERASDRCRREVPPLECADEAMGAGLIGAEHLVRCFHPLGAGGEAGG